MDTLGRRCRSGVHALESPERLFGRLVATELVALEFQEAILRKSDRSEVGSRLRALYDKAEQNLEVQLENHGEHKIAGIARRNGKETLDAFRASLNDAIDDFDENVLD